MAQSMLKLASSGHTHASGTCQQYYRKERCVAGEGGEGDPSYLWENDYKAYYAGTYHTHLINSHLYVVSL